MLSHHRIKARAGGKIYGHSETKSEPFFSEGLGLKESPKMEGEKRGEGIGMRWTVFEMDESAYAHCVRSYIRGEGGSFEVSHTGTDAYRGR